MVDSLVTKVWEDVSDRVGDDLRVVTRYESTDFETRMRDDVREQYTAAEDRVVVDDTILTQLVVDDTGQSFETGELHGIVRIFDDAWVLAWSDRRARKSGFIVSIQRDGATASMDDVDWCVRYLEDEVAPLLD